jgi:PST family polysaccharide transporter
VFWTATGNWGEQLAALFVFSILSRLLEPEAFGLVALASVFVGFTQLFADQGLADALVQRKQLDSAHLDSAFWMSIGFGVLLAAVLAALAVPIGTVLGQEQLAPVLVALSLAIPISSSSLVQRAILTRDMAFQSLTLRTLTATAVGGVFGVSAALLGFGVWSLVAQNFALQITGAIVLWRVTQWRPRFNVSYAHFRDLFGFGIHVVGFRLLNYWNRNADNFFIGSFLGPVSLGFYAVAFRMLRLLTQVTISLIDRVAFPLYSRLQDDPDRLRRAYYKSSSFAALVTLPAFIGSLVMAPEIVSVLFGSKWAASVPVMQVLTLVGIIRAFTYLNSSVLMARGKPSWRVAIAGATAVLSAIGFLLAVRHGIVAVAIAAVCIGFLVAPISYSAVNRLVPIDPRTYLKRITGPLVGSVLLTGVIVGLRHLLDNANTLVTLIVVSSAGVLVYAAAIWIFSRPLADEARDLARRALPTLGFPRANRLFTRR